MTYQLHDYEIDSIVLEKDSIVFSFPEGFYAEDDQGNSLMPLKKRLVFHIDTNGFPVESFLTVRRIGWSRRRWSEISFRKFTSLFKRGNMIIHDEYDSKLTNWKILKLNAISRRSNIELLITDIASIECLDESFCFVKAKEN